MKPAPTGLRGGQKKFFDHAIETALTLRLVFNLPLRQAEGFLRSVLSLMSVDLEAPDHTTLSRRNQSLNIDLHRVAGHQPIHLIVDSTGEIIAQTLTHGSADDARTALDLIDGIENDIASFTADSAYDTLAIYDVSTERGAERGAEVVIPPSKSATRSRQ